MAVEINDKVAKAIAAHLGKVPATPDVTLTPTDKVEKTITLSDGQQLFSKVFGYVPSFGDFAVTVLADSRAGGVARLVTYGRA